MDPGTSLIANQVGDPKLCYVLGDLEHKHTVYLCILTPKLEVANRHISIDKRAEWLCDHRPDLLPERDAQGNLPSTKHLSSIFCGHFYSDPTLAREYTSWLYANHNV